MSMAQMFPAAFQGMIVLMLGALAITVVTGIRWRYHGPWRIGHLTAAVLHAAALIITVVVATRVGWAAPKYTVAGVQMLLTVIAVWAALVPHGWPVPPRHREPLPEQGGQVIPMPPGQSGASDEAA